MWPSVDQIYADEARLSYQNICVEEGGMDSDGFGAGPVQCQERVHVSKVYVGSFTRNRQHRLTLLNMIVVVDYCSVDGSFLHKLREMRPTSRFLRTPAIGKTLILVVTMTF